MARNPLIMAILKMKILSHAREIKECMKTLRPAFNQFNNTFMWTVLEEFAKMDKKMTRVIYFYNALLFCSWQLVESDFRNWLYNK